MDIRKKKRWHPIVLRETCEVGTWKNELILIWQFAFFEQSLQRERLMFEQRFCLLLAFLLGMAQLVGSKTWQSLDLGEVRYLPHV